MPSALGWRLAAGATLLILAAPTLADADAVNWQTCQTGVKRITCVVDGDTIWYQGTKMRLIGIDAPEIDGNCATERGLVNQATTYLTALLNTGLTHIAYDGQDRYGRSLARFWVL